MIRNLIVVLLIFPLVRIFSQNVHPQAIDGQVYVKFTHAALKGIDRSNPYDVPVGQFRALRQVVEDYGVYKITVPYYQASDDASLPYVMKFHFSPAWKVGALIADLEKIAGVEYAERVSLNRIDATPNDFALSTASVHLTQINAQNAWNIFSGNSNVAVAIIDNAVMWTHADLIANTYTNTAEIANNGIDDDNNGYVDDVNGYDVADGDNDANPSSSQLTWDHGTHCAGIAGARTDNATGIASIGWNIKILPVKAESTNPSMVTEGYAGIIYAVKAKARIISCSWGNTLGFNITEQSVVNYAWARGSMVIAAAGNNSNNTLNFPGAYAHVYCVGAVDPNDVKAGYSSYGSFVDIMAPGTNIYSSVPYTSTPAYLVKSGTSMATPVVAGLAALMLSKSPNMTCNDVLNCISSTAANIYTLSGNSTYTGNLGAGRIDAYQAMLCAQTFTALPPVAYFFAYPVNTCPFTPVPFTDSSLYAPTAWSWTFQSGSPATSTLQNPVVQWNTPGTYSVALTVSNAQGTSTKTRLSYVVVSGSGPLPLHEGFESPAFLPPGWYANDIGNDQIYWERLSGLGAYGTSTACAIFDNYTYVAANDREEMRTPKYNFSAVTTASLHFDVAYARYDPLFSDSLEVRASVDCGQTWTTIYLKGGTSLATAPDASVQFTPSASQWRTDAVNISGLVAGQPNVMFSFVNRGHFGQPIYLDNINIAVPVPSVNISGPNGACSGNTITLVNTGGAASGYTWSTPGGYPSSSSGTSVSVSYTAAGIYSITLTATNGSATASVIRTITIVDPPVSVLSTTGTACTVGCGGMVNATTTGASPFTYSITGSSCTSLPCGGLCQGLYTLHTTDAYGCASAAFFSIGTTTALSAIVSHTNPTCSSCSDGTAEVNPSFGTPPYSYTWTPGGANTAIVGSLSQGCYTVLVRDAGGCEISAEDCLSGDVSVHAYGDRGSIRVFPNPATGIFFVESPSAFAYQLYGTLGQVLATGQSTGGKTVVDVNALAAGIYCLSVKTSADEYATRIIVR